MRILSVQPYNNYRQTPSFGVNLQSKKLKFKNDDFFVLIRGYGQNSDWAKKIIETADKVVNFIRNNLGFEESLKLTVQGVTEANKIPLDLKKRMHTGILRTQRAGWRYGSDWDKSPLITKYSSCSANKYRTYADKLDRVVLFQLTNPYLDISLTRPVHDKEIGKYIRHGNANNIENAFIRVNKIYEKIYDNYVLNEIKPENLSDANSLIAEMRWILAHATPWERGSDAISNTFMRAIYKAMGVKTYPLKRGISLDLEAFCTNLDEYKKFFTTYFQRKPEIID